MYEPRMSMTGSPLRKESVSQEPRVRRSLLIADGGSEAALARKRSVSPLAPPRHVQMETLDETNA